MIWQKAVILVTETYDCTRSFPKEELFVLTSQLRRSALSIPSNISEGFGRYSNRDFLRFISIARGSLFEFQTQVEIANRLTYLTNQQFNKIYNLTTELDAMMTSFASKLKKTLQ